MSDPPSRPRSRLRRALGALSATLGSARRFERLLLAARGDLGPKEGRALADSARAVTKGAVVGIGSWRGRAVAALAHGLRDSDRPIYCLDPHGEDEGVPGGRAGPESRAEAGIPSRVRRIDRPASEVGESWHEPIGLLFLDGDRGYEAVRGGFESFYPRILAGGTIALDDGRREGRGAGRLLREILPSRRLRILRRAGRITFLQKLEHLTLRPKEHLRFLVACHELIATGGLIRFERFGREIGKLGDELAFLCFGNPGRAQFESQFPILSLAEASASRWDVIMVPGQGFPRATIRRFAELRDPRFGQRVQHVLNDPSKLDGFLEVNRRFEPHAVVFNTRAWTPGSYTRFVADRFSTIEGAVDVEACRGPREGRREGFHVGGVGKAPMRAFWREFARRMPEHWTLHLFGTDPGIADRPRVEFEGRLAESELAAFYRKLDAVVQAETFAGWANAAAEAMAAGVPVVCTPAGTAAFAEHGKTARVVGIAAPPDLCADVLAELDWVEANPTEARAMAERASERIGEFDWTGYSRRLRAFCRDDGRSHYTFAPELGLLGKWPREGRLEGLEPVLSEIAGMSVLDLGCAEGIVARACLDHGADVVHGFELDPSRVATCLDLDPEPRSWFAAASLAPWDRFVREQRTLRRAYDAVFYLGIHHHLPKGQRRAVLEGALKRCRSLFVIRTPDAVWQGDELDRYLRGRGLVPVAESAPALRDQGRLGVYRRATVPADLARRDLRVVSFPKSGRSWIRFALTRLGIADRIEFEHDGFEYNDGRKPPLDFDATSRWEKCHRADRVVYLSRDPRDVIVSLFHQVTGRFRDFFHYEGELGAFIRDPYFGAHNLRDFQRMWQGVVDAGLAEHVTYEQAHEDFEGTLRRVLDGFGFQVSDEEIRDAGEAARFDNMKAVEASGAFEQPWLRPRNEAPKVRRGEVGGFRTELSAEDQAWLNEVFGTTE